MKNSNAKYYILLQLLLLVFSFGGVASKTAAGEQFLSFRWIMLYGILILILGIYAIFWQQLLKHILLSRAYACKALGIIWTMLWGVVFFHEQITVKNIIGAVLVMIGVLLVTVRKEQHDDTD